MAPLDSTVGLTRKENETLLDYIHRVFGTQTAFARTAGLQVTEVNRFLNHPDMFGNVARDRFIAKIMKSIGIDFSDLQVNIASKKSLYDISQSPYFHVERTAKYKGMNMLYEPFSYQGQQTVAPLYAIWHKLYNDLRGVCSIEAFELQLFSYEPRIDLHPQLRDLRGNFVVLPPAGNLSVAESRYGVEIHHKHNLCAIIVKASELTQNPRDDIHYLTLTVTPPRKHIGYEAYVESSSTFLEYLQERNMLKQPLQPDGLDLMFGALHEWDSFAKDQFGYYCKMVGEHMMNLEKAWNKIAHDQKRESRQYTQKVKR